MPFTNPLIHTLKSTRNAGRMALCGYFLVGYPTPDGFYQMVRAAADLDIIEYGIPAENPSMDGTVIAHAHEVVTAVRGIHAEPALALIGGLRSIPQPRIVMTYVEVGRNLDGFLRLCVENQVHGMIAPDMDASESQHVKIITSALNLALILLLDARADDATVAQVCDLADVIYLKASTGRTGQSADIDGDLRDTIQHAVHRIRKIKPEMPIAVGIGLQRPEQVNALTRLDVDMAVVGTKIVEHLQSGEQSLVDYVHALREATYYD